MNSRIRLLEKRDAIAAAFGDEHRFVTTIDTAIATGDEGIAEATSAWVDRVTTGTEAAGLAAVAREISADRTPPVLVALIDIATPTAPAHCSMRADQFVLQDGAVRVAWAFRREPLVTVAKEPLAARVIAPPTGVNWALVEAAARVAAPRLGSAVSPAASLEPRRALLAAAIERAAKTSTTITKETNK
jgi:hypothetical protein